MLPPLVALAVLVMAEVVIAALAGRTGVVVAILLLALPRLVEAPAFGRFVLALVVALAFIRAIDLVRTPIERFSSRILHLVAYVDTRRLTPGPRGVDRMQLASAAPWLMLCGVMLLVGLTLPLRLGGVLHWVVRWGTCVVFALALFEVVARVVPALWAAAGWRTPVLHDAPWRSRSLHEFWGRRWNLTVGGWLRENVYEPLRTRVGENVAMLAAFAGSGLIHAYVVAMALGVPETAMMSAFFVVQGALMALEGPLRIDRWPVRAGQGWAIGWMVATAPLFLEPMLRLVDPLVR